MYRFAAILILTIFLFSGISSCRKDPGAAPDLGFNYFPKETGHYVIYDVDSIVYNATSYSYPVIRDTFRFRIKEKIQSVFTDNEGREALRLERYVKYYNPSVPYSAMTWTLRNVWVENRTLRDAEKVEENERFIKLIFPLKTDVTWDGNAQNSRGEEIYNYAFIDIPRTVGNIHFDSVLEVDQHNTGSLVDQLYKEEKYARNVGMIYKRVINVNSQPPLIWYGPPQVPNLSDSLDLFYQKPILQRADSGYELTMTISSYGTE